MAESFVISGESAEAGGPGEASLDEPSSWQQDEAALGLGVFDYLQPDAMLSRRVDCGLTSVALAIAACLSA
jgi:hypothetical protein